MDKWFCAGSILTNLQEYPQVANFFKNHSLPFSEDETLNLKRLLSSINVSSRIDSTTKQLMDGLYLKNNLEPRPLLRTEKETNDIFLQRWNVLINPEKDNKTLVADAITVSFIASL